MKAWKKIAFIAALSGLFVPMAAVPDDIDLYTGGEQFTGAPLNVLIVLDNTSNFSATNQGWTDDAGNNIAQGQVEAEVLIDVIRDLAQDSINIGLMQYADKGGGYPIFAIRENSQTNLDVFEAINTSIRNNVGDPAYKGPTSGDYDELLNSVFRYYNSFAPQAARTSGRSDQSNQGDLRDYAGNTSPVSRDALGQHGYPAGLATFSGPVSAAAGCAKNFVIFIGNGYPSKSAADAKSRLNSAGALFTPAVVPETSGVTVAESQAQVAPYWTRFMRQYGVKSVVDDVTVSGGKKFNPIHTYTIDVCNAQCDANQKSLLQSMADQGRGRYFRSTDKTELRNALATIFAEIQAVNSVFASATLPVSVNTQGTYENQVYIGVFRPDAQARPRWFGNLKEYQFARYCDANANDRVDDIGNAPDERIDREAGNTGTVPTCTGDTLKLFLADKDNRPAIDQTLSTGFIDTAATSFWSAASSYWSFLPSASGSVSDAPDGPNVERGGAAQQLRAKWAETGTPDGRKVYTCLGTCLAPADALARNLSNHAFVLSNSEVATALTAPSGTVSVTSLVRTGETVTATTAVPHGFASGNSVTISGATKPAFDAYNGAKTLLSASGSTFTFAITETPPTSATGTVAANSTPSSVSSVSLSSGLPGSTVTVTLDPVGSIPSGTTQVSVSGTGQSYLDGVRSGAVNVATGNFVFSTTLPAAPGNATGVTAAGAGATATGLDASYDAATNRFTISNGTSNLPGGLKGAPVGTTVTISNSSDPLYNGDWKVLVSGNKALTFAYRTYTGCGTGGTAPSCTGASAAPVGAVSDTITISRVVGATTATVTRGAADNLSALANGDSVTLTIAGDPASPYNGNWTIANVDAVARTFTIGPLTLGPSTPAAGTIQATLTGVAAGPSTSNLIAWMRGRDLWEDENKNDSLSDVRASVHGDVLHSRPLLINYGGLLGVVGYYGSNDGFMRAIQGGVASTDGKEKWAFIPSEFTNYQKLARLYENAHLIRYPNSSCSATPPPTTRGYFWDGQFTAYQSPNVLWYRTDPAVTTSTRPADCTSANPCYSRPEKVYMYAGMRRGGSAYYALDVSLPDSPKFLWRITAGAAGFENLGQTWSEPTVAKIRGKLADGTTDDFRDVLIFGGGYDPTDDDKAPGSLRGNSPTGKGRGVYIVNALTGALIKHIEPAASVRKFSISADVKVIDLDGDGYVDRIYAADTGGQVFRIDINAAGQLSADSTYTMYHIANLGDANANGGSDARKFLFAPDILPFVYTNSDGVAESAIMILVGSGDREKPLPNTGVSAPPALTCPALYPDAYFGTPVIDRFYGLIDKVAAGTAAGSVSPILETDLHEINAVPDSLAPFDMCLGFEAECGDPAAPVTPKRGWYVTLGDGSSDEEKLVNAPRVVSGVLLFGTNTPEPPDTASGICSNLGRAASYAIDPFLGMPAFDRDGDGQRTASDFAAVVVGGGLPPTVTAGVVEIDGTFHRFVIGAGGKGEVSSSPIEGAKNPISLKGTRSRVYWYYPVDEK